MSQKINKSSRYFEYDDNYEKLKKPLEPINTVSSQNSIKQKINYPTGNSINQPPNYNNYPTDNSWSENTNSQPLPTYQRPNVVLREDSRFVGLLPMLFNLVKSIELNPTFMAGFLIGTTFAWLNLLVSQVLLDGLY